MQTTKYQVFVSSTYTDLKAERDQVIKAILEMGHIPVGMEMFSAADEEQWKMITRQIDQSDYYIVIVAHRYGSTVRGISYTEKEYNYAVKRGIPVLGFVLGDKVAWPPEFIESDAEMKESLKKFKTKVKRKLVDFWMSKEHLYAQVSVALSKAFNTTPRPGWVRVSDVPGVEVLTELSRLSSENAELRSQLDDLKKNIFTSQFAQGTELLEIPYTFYRNGERRKEPGVKQGIYQVSWDKMFQTVGEAILSNPFESSVIRFTNGVFSKQIEAVEQGVAQENILVLSNYKQKVKLQLMALDLIDVQSNKNRFNITEPQWILTPKGKEKLFESLAANQQIALIQK